MSHGSVGLGWKPKFYTQTTVPAWHLAAATQGSGTEWDEPRRLPGKFIPGRHRSGSRRHAGCRNWAHDPDIRSAPACGFGSQHSQDLTMQMSLQGTRFQDSTAVSNLVDRGVVERVQSVPGVIAEESTRTFPIELAFGSSFITEGGAWE
jgi:hypothetical protein